MPVTAEFSRGSQGTSFLTGVTGSTSRYVITKQIDPIAQQHVGETSSPNKLKAELTEASNITYIPPLQIEKPRTVSAYVATIASSIIREYLQGAF